MLFFSKKMKKQLDDLSAKLETTRINEYVNLLNNTPKLLWKNFLSGVAKGIGIAIGFTILGAIVILFLRKVVALNIPLIGRFISDIAEIVEVELQK